MRSLRTWRLACAGLLAAGASVALTASVASASAQTASVAGQVFDLGPSPIGVGNCSFANGDASFKFVTGNGVQHDTTNKNGDWGGLTAEGTAWFQENGTPMYLGHATLWGGGGNNAGSQTEGGFTLSFTGTGTGGTLTIHLNQHTTTNNGGTTTSSHLDGSIVCS